MTPDGARTLRDRHADLADLADRLRSDAPDSAVSMVVTTVAVSAYPTSASAYYGVQAADPGGVEAEGNAGTFGPGSGTFYALNLGPMVPPVGTKLIVESVNGRWVFRYG